VVAVAHGAAGEQGGGPGGSSGKRAAAVKAVSPPKTLLVRMEECIESFFKTCGGGA
jgi:hypothetical protein